MGGPLVVKEWTLRFVWLAFVCLPVPILAADPPAALRTVLSAQSQWEVAPHGRGNVYAPHVLREPEGFKMWYGAQGRDGHDRIGYAESSDGWKWKSVGVAIDRGQSNHVNDPTVDRVGAKYYLYFTRADRDVVDQIDLAVSDDGRHWELRGVVLPPGEAGTWDSLLVGRPSVLYEEGQFKMWYDGRKDLGPGSPAKNVPISATSTRNVGYATSQDGVHWTRSPQNPVFGHGAGGIDVQRVGETLVMLYESGAGTAIASSPDGIHWANHGLWLPISGGPEDQFGHVTPFLWNDPQSGDLSLFMGLASSRHWNQQRIGRIAVTKEQLARGLQAKQ